MGTRILQPESASSGAAIGAGVRIIGQIYSKEDLYVSGDLQGSVEVVDHTLTIGPNATLHASVNAREIVVLGMIEGNVEATERIEIRKEAEVIGDIRTPRIIIEDGAYLKGSIDVLRTQSPRLAIAPEKPVVPAVNY
jgi:cytoskeletal protein CcmA (bactofilin family)